MAFLIVDVSMTEVVVHSKDKEEKPEKTCCGRMAATPFGEMNAEARRERFF